MRKLFFLTFFLFINTLVTRDRINVSKLSNHSLEPFLKFSCNICFSNFFNISKVEEGFFFGGIMQTCRVYKIWMKKEPKNNNYQFVHWNSVHLALFQNILTYVLVLK